MASGDLGDKNNTPNFSPPKTCKGNQLIINTIGHLKTQMASGDLGDKNNTPIFHHLRHVRAIN